MAGNKWWEDFARTWNKYKVVQPLNSAPTEQNNRTLPEGKVAPGENPDAVSVYDLVCLAAEKQCCLQIMYKGESKTVEPRDWRGLYFYAICRGCHSTKKNLGFTADGGMHHHLASFLISNVSDAKLLPEVHFAIDKTGNNVFGPGLNPKNKKTL